jgi:hypothetical protein
MTRARDSPEDDGVEVEGVFDDSCRRNSNPQDVLLSRQVVWLGYSIDVGEITVQTTTLVQPLQLIGDNNLLFGRVCELVLPPTIITFLNACIIPEVLDGFHVWSIEGRYRFVVYCSNQFSIFLSFQKEQVSDDNSIRYQKHGKHANVSSTCFFLMTFQK